jgi:Ser/Thr protein kinase RdoA (MazF antagonist)
VRTVDPEVCARWRLTAGPVLGDRADGTWEATRNGVRFVVKLFGAEYPPDWRYTLRVAAAIREQGWPTPEPAEEPLVTPHGAWVLFHRLPGRARTPTSADRPAEERARGRLLAEFHEAAAATGITEQRDGFTLPADVVNDPELERWLRLHERARPDEGRALRACREAVAQWFDDNATPDAPRSVIHGDFAPWNLLYDGDRLTGVLDFEATHHTFQVADFALSWRGYHDDVLRGYDEVRALSGTEWRLVRPVFWAWLFLGVTKLPPSTGLEWQLSHLRKQSPLLTKMTG